ncbi:MAG: tRNA (adenine-N1)-methyltransferase [Nitrososphaerota archaeon]
MFHENEYVVLITEKGNRYFLTLRNKRRYHTNEGSFSADDIIGKEEGVELTSNIGQRAVVFRPTIIEYLLSLPRRTQITYPKDIGFLVATTGLGPGSKVVEGGTGSGVLALFLAWHVKPNGKVYSYDLDDEYFPAIRRHADALGLSNVIELKKGDLSLNVEEKDVDVFIADVPEPWRSVESAYKSLKTGGIYAAIVPTVEQLIKTSTALKLKGFFEYFSGEVFFRPWRVKEGMTRPQHTMRAHTVFIIIARKTSIIDTSSWAFKLPDGYK